MQCSRHRRTSLAAVLAVVLTVSLGAPGAALGDDVGALPGLSAMERLQRQEDARKAELARFAEAARQIEAATTRDALERAMLERAVIAQAATDDPTSSGAVDDFDWAAAAIGLGAGVAVTCLLLGGVALVRGAGRLRGA